MESKIGITIIIEKEEHNDIITFIASSPEINVLAEGKTVEEVRAKFIEGVKFHLKSFPEDKKLLIKGEKEMYDMPLVSRVFL